MKAILTYHSVDPSGSPVSVDEDTFRRHVAWLAMAGPKVVPLRELLSSGAEGDAVALTFDDGFTSFARIAAPLLLEHGLPATVFAVADRAGLTNAWGGRDEPGIPTLPLMGWDELGRQREAGFEIGAHSRTHPRLAGLPAAALEEEILGSADDVARHLGERPRSFCYPYGSVDDAAASVVSDAFDVACTTELAFVESGADPVRLPRLDMVYFRNGRRLEAWGRPSFRGYVRFRAAGRRVRETLARSGAMGRA